MKIKQLLPFLLPLTLHGQNLELNEFSASNATTVVPNSITGTFEDWIEIKNSDTAPVDLGGWHLTDDASDLNQWTFPSNTLLNPGQFLVVFASGLNTPDANGNLHTNFKLSKAGDYLALVRPDNSLASEFGPDGAPFPTQTDDVSYGLHPTSSEAVFFSTPTPGADNDPGGIARVADLQATPKRGFYQSAQSISLSTATAGAAIYFTTDGTPPLDESGTPTASAQSYNGPIAVNTTTVLRAAASLNGFAPTPGVTHTYVLLDIDGAGVDGTDPAGLNNSLLQQTQPAGYGALASGDYNMDTRISKSTASSAGHGTSSVAQAMLQGMRDIPIISIALPKEDFAGGTGIYSNPQSEGIAWERACSAEFIPAENDTRPDFQENCGLRVQGGASRLPSKSPKHSLSFRFREEYGAGRLKQTLFPNSDATSFNSIALRAGFNNSWAHWDAGQRNRGSMIRDQWMRESMREMGHPDAGAGFHAHIFINGLYWGVHNIAERQDNSHYAEYNGGDANLIDALNGTGFVEGNSTAWNFMKSTVATKNWAAIKQVLDVDTYIDYQLLQRYGANEDLKVDGNWRAAGGGPFTTATDMRPWKLFSWDGERVLEVATSTKIPLDPMNIRPTLESMPEYRLRFADRARMHLTGDGALTPTRAQARWAKYADEIDRAIIAESARWGDHWQASPYTRTTWLSEQSRLYNTYFPVRTNNVINRLVGDGLYNAVDVPEFRIDGGLASGGYLAPGSSLTTNGPQGTIYYTLDGSDPANEDGSVNPSALSLPSGIVSESVFPFESSGWRYLAGTTALSNSDVVAGAPSYSDSNWKHESFQDNDWTPGTGLMGGRSGTAVSVAAANTIIDIGPIGQGYPTIYFRKTFNVTNASEVTSLNVSVIRDDGFVLYLNGKEIFRDNMPSGTVNYGTFASGNAIESDIPSTTYNLTPGDLIEGTNVIAIEVHNASAGSSDLGVDVSLELSRPIGAANINLSNSAQVTARSRVGTTWSPSVTGLFLLETPAGNGNLVISEINYHPREATISEKTAALPLDLSNADDFEFIELFNTSGSALNLAGVKFTTGVELEFGFRIVEPGERVLIVRNEDAFLERYGSSLADSIAGTYAGGLDNDGDTLTLTAADGSLIESITYSDAGSWPSRPDGAGSSLERIDPSAEAANSENWATSVAFHGSPGISGALADQRIVINEVSSNSANDFIELYNTTAGPIDLAGWLLTDSKTVYRSFAIPTGTIDAMSYLTIDATAFNAPATTPVGNYSGTPGASPTTVASTAHGLVTGDLITIEGYGGFSDYNNSFEVSAINANSFQIDTPFLDNHATKGNWQNGRSFGLSSGPGDDLWLLETDSNGNPVAFVDHVEFAAAAADSTLGRWLNGEGYNTLTSMITNTKGAPNSGPLLGPVFISEVHYAPSGGDAHEFVEITNQGAETIALDHWRLRGGVDFDFTTAHSLAPGASLVIVKFDPAIDNTLATDFRNAFGIDHNVPLVGPLTDGPLNNSQGTVRLQKPGPAPDFFQITADEVRYSATSPWPTAIDGTSLQRTSTLAFGNFANSWNASLPTPGSIPAGVAYSTWASNLGIGSETEDPDGDQLSNLLEFALGSDPLLQTAMPEFSVEDGLATVSFSRHAGHQGVQLIFETSLDLNEWTPTETNVISTVGNLQNRKFEFSPSSRPKFYWRLRAVAN